MTERRDETRRCPVRGTRTTITFGRLKEFLLPVFDRTFSALILDLEQRGLLDETLVLVISEHGRTPQIDSKPKGAGRHHWSRAYSQVYAGGGPRDKFGVSDSEWRSVRVADAYHIQALVTRGVVLGDCSPEPSVAQVFVEEQLEWHGPA